MKKLKINKLQIFFMYMFVISISYIGCYCYCNIKDRQNNKEIKNIFYKFKNESTIIEEKSQKISQLEELQKENIDIVGWIKILGTDIDYPVLQTVNNSYYLTHNYKKKYSYNGSIFLDKDVRLEKPSTNYLVYGHRNKNRQMFDGLINYKKETYYKEHPIIQFTTINEDVEYEIIAVFLSRVYYNNEKDVFRYYYFIDANNKEEFEYYINSSKKGSLYDTGKTAQYGDQLLTLSTCEGSQKDGRLIVVARKK